MFTITLAKIFRIFGFFSLVSSSLLAAEMTLPQIREKLKKYSALASFRAQFVQVKEIKDMGLKLKSEGDLTVTRPSKVIWHVKTPSELTMTLEGQHITLVKKEGSEEKKQTFSLGQASKKDSKAMEDMVAWLRLDADAIAKSYRLTSEKNGEITCVPKSESKGPIRSFRMHLTDTGFLDKLTLQEASGDSLVIRFTKPETLE